MLVAMGKCLTHRGERGNDLPDGAVLVRRDRFYVVAVRKVAQRAMSGHIILKGGWKS